MLKVVPTASVLRLEQLFKVLLKVLIHVSIELVPIWSINLIFKLHFLHETQSYELFVI